MECHGGLYLSRVQRINALKSATPGLKKHHTDFVQMPQVAKAVQHVMQAHGGMLQGAGGELVTETAEAHWVFASHPCRGSGAWRSWSQLSLLTEWQFFFGNGEVDSGVSRTPDIAFATRIFLVRQFFALS